VLQDRESAVPADDADEDDDADDGRSMVRALLREGLLPALQTSPVVFRAFLRWFNLLAKPDALIADGEVVTAVMEAYAARDTRPPPEPFGPSREELLETLRSR
jgi:hypothetical protein